MANYGSDAGYSNQQMIDFRTFAQSQGYGTSIAPEQFDAYSKFEVIPGAAGNVNNSPAVITFYNSGTTNVFQDVQDPVIRNGSQVPTQNLLGIYGVSLEVSFPAPPGAATDLEAINQVYSDSVFEFYIAGDRQFMCKGAQIYNVLGTTPGTSAVATGLGSATGLSSHIWPSTKLVMPGSTIRAELQIDGTNAAFAAGGAGATHNLTLHVWAFNARR